MQVPAPLLTAIGQAVLDAIDSGVLSDAVVQADAGMAENVWKLWTAHTAEPSRRERAHAIAPAAPDGRHRLQSVDERAPAPLRVINEILIRSGTRTLARIYPG